MKKIVSTNNYIELIDTESKSENYPKSKLKFTLIKDNITFFNADTELYAKPLWTDSLPIILNDLVYTNLQDLSTELKTLFLVSPQGITDRGTVYNAITTLELTYRVTSAVPNESGTDYKVGDYLIIPGLNTEVNAVVEVRSITDLGEIIEVRVLKQGDYTHDITADSVVIPGGSGTGATFDIISEILPGSKLSDVLDPKVGDRALVLVDELHEGNRWWWTMLDYDGDGTYQWVPLQLDLSTSRDFFTNPILSSELATDAVTTIKLQDSNITKAKLDVSLQSSINLANSALQSFEEVDPTVPDWAKEDDKPTYTKEEVGLGNVDNTSDANKPVSTAQATAILLKAAKVVQTGGTGLPTVNTEGITTSIRAIQTSDLSDNIITTLKINLAAITTEKINNAAVTNDKLANIAGYHLKGNSSLTSGVPTDVPFTTFSLSPDAQTQNTQVMLAPATKGNLPDLKLLTGFVLTDNTQTITGVKAFQPAVGDQTTIKTQGITPIRVNSTQQGFLIRSSDNNVGEFLMEANGASNRRLIWRTSLDNGSNWTNTSYLTTSMPTITTFNYATLKSFATDAGSTLVYRYDGSFADLSGAFIGYLFNVNGTYFQGVMTHYLTGETITYQINSTSTTVYRYNKIYTTSVTAKNLQFSYTRSGNTVRVQCSGDAINTALNAWDDIISIPDGYNPKIGSGQDSIWVFSKLGNAVQDFQIINKIIRSPYAIASGTFIRFAATWITDQSFPS